MSAGLAFLAAFLFILGWLTTVCGDGSMKHPYTFVGFGVLFFGCAAAFFAGVTL